MQNNDHTFETSITREGYTMRATLERQSLDVLIQVIGGDVPHYGVVMTVDNTGQTEVIAMPSRPGHVHQEKVLINPVIKAIKPALQNNAIIVSGMHVNDITPAQMQAAVPMAKVLGERLADWLMAHPGHQTEIAFAK